MFSDSFHNTTRSTDPHSRSLRNWFLSESCQPTRHGTMKEYLIWFSHPRPNWIHTQGGHDNKLDHSQHRMWTYREGSQRYLFIMAKHTRESTDWDGLGGDLSTMSSVLSLFLPFLQQRREDRHTTWTSLECVQPRSTPNVFLSVRTLWVKWSHEGFSDQPYVRSLIRVRRRKLYVLNEF